jgi:hypothetical protein
VRDIVPQRRAQLLAVVGARRLTQGDLDWLIGEILQARDGSSDVEIDAAWKSEVERRVADSEAGTAVTCS